MSPYHNHGLNLLRSWIFTERTCFANDLATLVRLPGSIRESNVVNEAGSQKTKANAPREVMRLINWLTSNASGIVRAIS